MKKRESPDNETNPDSPSKIRGGARQGGGVEKRPTFQVGAIN